MGGVLTTCKQRRSSHVTENNSNVNDDGTRRSFRPRVRIRDERQSDTLSSTYATIYHQQLKDSKKRRDDLFVKKEPSPDYDYEDEHGNGDFLEHQTIIRDRGLRTVSSRITIHSENKSETYNIESESYYDFSYMGLRRPVQRILI